MSKWFCFTKENQFNIISRAFYSTKYTFFITMFQNVRAEGHLFTSDTGNKLLSYWDGKYGSIFIDDNINLNGKGVNDERYVFTLRNDNNQKTAFVNNEQYFSTRFGTNNWGRVIGTPISHPTVAGKGYVYEVMS